MTTFVLVYRAPKDYLPGDPDAMRQWQQFFGTLGEHLVDPGNPVFSRSTLGNTESVSDLSGYSLITADDAASAKDLASGCPMLKNGGGVEIGELTPLTVTGIGEEAASARVAG